MNELTTKILMIALVATIITMSFQNREQQEAINEIKTAVTAERTDQKSDRLLNPDYLESIRENSKSNMVVVNPPKSELRMYAAAAKQEREGNLQHIRVQNSTGYIKNQGGGYTIYGDFAEAQAPDPYSGLQGAFVGKTLSYGTIVAVTKNRISVALN